MPFGAEKSSIDALWGGLSAIFMLTCFLAVPTSFISLIVAASMRRTRAAIAAGIALTISSLAAGIPLFYWLSNPHPIRTAVNATPAEVTFLKLPTSAAGVSYWDNNYYWMAEFMLPEKDFLAVFPRFQFSPIIKRESVNTEVYGDPDRPPYQRINSPVRIVTSGLIYETQQGNGGGFRIIYDRDTSRGYFRYIAR